MLGLWKHAVSKEIIESVGIYEQELVTFSVVVLGCWSELLEFKAQQMKLINLCVHHEYAWYNSLEEH